LVIHVLELDDVGGMEIGWLDAIDVVGTEWVRDVRM